jgi:hypothetical protein
MKSSRGGLLIVALVLPVWAGAAVDIRVNAEQTAAIDLTCAGDPTVTRSQRAEPGRPITFANVEPGACEWWISSEGSEPVGSAFTVRAGESTSWRLTRESSAGLHLQLLERRREGEGVLFDARAFAEFPSSRNLWGLPETLDAVAIVDRMDNGGLYPGEAGHLSAHGSSWTQTSFRLGEIDMTDPLQTGMPLIDPGLDVLEAIDFANGVSIPARNAGPGSILTLVPLRPGEQWHGALQGYATGESGSATRPPAIARYGHWRDFSAVARGPVSESTGLLAAARLTSGQRQERDATNTLASNVAAVFTRLTHRSSERSEWGLIAAFEALERPSSRRALFEDRDSAADETAFHLQGTWAHEAQSGPHYRIAMGYQSRRRDPGAAPRQAYPVERLSEGPIPSLVAARTDVHRFDLVGRAEFRAGGHEIELGTELSRSAATQAPNDAVTIPELLNGSAARIWEYGVGNGESHWQLNDISLYAEDHFDIGRRISLDAGLRYDGSWATAGTSESISWHALAPRVAARVRLTPGGSLALLGSWGLYRQRLPLHYLAWGDSNAPQGEVYRWRDRNEDLVYQEDERGQRVISRVGPGGSFSRIDTNLRAPRTEAFLVGLEARISDTWAVRFVGVHRRMRDLVESVNTGVPDSSYDLFFIPDPAGDIDGSADDQQLPVYELRLSSFGDDAYLLTNPEGHSALHEGVEFSLTRWLGERFRLVLGATAARTEGAPANQGFRVNENDHGLIGELYDNPNANTMARGREFFDRAYTISLAGSYRAPGDWRAAFVSRYQDGQPFSRLVILSDLSQGPTAIRSVYNGRHRFTFTLNLDLRLEKGFSLGGERRLAAVVEGFNLLGTNNEVEEDVATGEDFRTITAVQPPRALRFGVRFDF